jgi:hypothetical protein
MKKGFLLLVFIAQAGYAQMVERALPGEDFAFSVDFIVFQKIRSIKLEKARKKASGRIENTGESQTWFFNDLGLPTKKLIVSVSNSATLDSSFEYNYFDKKNHLITTRTFSPNLITAVYYTYDSLGNAIKIVHAKETNAASGNDLFQLGRQDISSIELFSFEKLNDAQTRKKYLNDEGKVYKEGIIYYDKDHRITEESYQYTTTGVRMDYKYSYNFRGQLTEYSFYSDAAGEQTEKTTYTYDSSGLLSQLNYAGTHQPIREVFYFHNKQTNFLEATLSKDPITGQLLIGKFIVATY